MFTAWVSDLKSDVFHQFHHEGIVPIEGLEPQNLDPKSSAYANSAIPAIAEKTGFEPVVPISRNVCLANRWFQPLTHFSI